MGDAINIAMNKVKTKFSYVIWSDQIYLNNDTIKKTINFFLKKNLFYVFLFIKKNYLMFIL